jgi:single-stranded-DNA-specific exonuclease
MEGLNARRQWLTRQVTDAALAQVERDPSLLSDHHALVLSHPTWPGGIVGIVAGRLAERFGKPAVLIADPPGKLARGSARSVPGVDLIAALTDCALLLERYGGHTGAAGFSIEAERIPELRAALSRAVAARTEILPEPTLPIDAYVELSDLTLELVAEIKRLAPFGPGNSPLTLAIRDLCILGETTIGRTSEHRRLTVQDVHDRTQTVFWWQGAGRPLPQGQFDLAVTVRASDYRGVAEVQVEWLQARELESAPTEVRSAPSVEVHDFRTVSNPEAVLRGLAAEGELQIWAEGDVLPSVQSCSRNQLTPSPRLAVWTLPPGPAELQAALSEVQPTEVLLFANDPALDQVSTLLTQLAGMVRFSLRTRNGLVDLKAAAARTAQRVSTVQAGLNCLEAQGKLAVMDRQEDAWQLSKGKGDPDQPAVELARLRLDALLAETAAYRTYFQNAPAAGLVRT